MAWQDTAIPLLRTLINDNIYVNKYDDSRLEELLVHSAYFLIQESDFDNTYTIKIDVLSISPDPVDNNDKAFINLLCMKAACIFTQNEAKTLAAKAYRVSDGPSSIDVSSAYKASLEMHQDCLNKYNKLLMLHKMGQAGQAVLTPYTSLNVHSEHDFS